MFGPRHEYRLGIILREVYKLPRGARVLDAAVGLGQLAGRMQQRGYDVIGIDYSFEAALHVRKTLGIPAVIGDMTRLPFRSNAFAGVTTGETLEHLDDDASAVAELARVLDTGGICVATVPALQSLWTASDDYYEHRCRRASICVVPPLCDEEIDELNADRHSGKALLQRDLLRKVRSREIVMPRLPLPASHAVVRRRAAAVGAGKEGGVDGGHARR